LFALVVVVGGGGGKVEAEEEEEEGEETTLIVCVFSLSLSLCKKSVVSNENFLRLAFFFLKTLNTPFF
jgi:hypothetical protein